MNPTQLLKKELRSCHVYFLYTMIPRGAASGIVQVASNVTPLDDMIKHASAQQPHKQTTMHATHPTNSQAVT